MRPFPLQSKSVIPWLQPYSLSNVRNYTKYCKRYGIEKKEKVTFTQHGARVKSEAHEILTKICKNFVIIYNYQNMLLDHLWSFLSNLSFPTNIIFFLLIIQDIKWFSILWINLDLITSKFFYYSKCQLFYYTSSFVTSRVSWGSGGFEHCFILESRVKCPTFILLVI